METETFDLIVIGGGPGGSTLSSFVAMDGHKVLLLERDKLPRYQIGESLLPSTIHGICSLLGIRDDVINAGFVRKHGACMRWGKNPEPWLFDFRQSRVLQKMGGGFAFQVERAKFDNMLLRNAEKKGVDVREESRVENLLVEDGRVVGVRYTDASGAEREARARYVADAGGNTSPHHTYVGTREYSKFFQNIAFFTYFENGGRLPEPNSGNILCAAFSDGWFWYIPLSKTLTSVGAVVAKEHAEKLKGDPEKVMAGLVAACPKIAELLAGATRVTEGMYGQFRIRKDYSYLNTKFWKPGIVLIGDAACFIDPVLSTGVHLATYSALLAARSINTCLRGEIDEQAAFDEMEYRYRDEYNNFYDFLVAFYDMHVDQDSYFWNARKVLNSEEQSNEAFIRLVGGGANAADFFGARSELGSMLAKHSEKNDTLDVPGLAKEMIEKTGRFQGDGMRDIGPDREKVGRQRGLAGTSDGLRWVRVSDPM
jgi:FAD-dependent halogenase